MLETLPTILIAAATEGSAEPAEAIQSPMYYPLMWLVRVGVVLLVVGITLCLWRMVKGPHLADRVLAGDTMAMLVAGLVIVLALKYGSGLYYDAALVVAILGFVSTVAFAQYIGAKQKYAELPAIEGDSDEGGGA